MRLRPRQRLSRQADFAAVRKEGRRQFGAAFILSTRMRPPVPGQDLPRFAVVASRRVGKAHVRNLLKRRLRAIFREHQAIFPAEADVVVTLKAGVAGVSYKQLETEFLSAARRSGFPAANFNHGGTEDTEKDNLHRR
ncbi:MAG: ribonuclease P protein component [Opitutaceae bacterium]